MKSVYSSTGDSLYDFFIPITAWCWSKLNIGNIIFTPENKTETISFSMSCAKKLDIDVSFYDIRCPKHKEATFMQCSRLYAAALDLPEDEVLITSDVDMGVFAGIMEYLNWRIPQKTFIAPPILYQNILQESISVIGTDLVPMGQLPMCYVVGKVKNWRKAFDITNQSYQELLDKELAHEECENMRGNLWSRDQELLHNYIGPTSFHSQQRARSGTQFATNRVDRDDINWRSYCGPDLIDAHLWRPGYTDENFANILELLQAQYPNDNFDWLISYREQYIRLL